MPTQTRWDSLFSWREGSSRRSASSPGTIAAFTAMAWLPNCTSRMPVTPTGFRSIYPKPTASRDGWTGFDTSRTLIAVIHPLPGRYSGEHSWDRRRWILQRVTSVPGIEAVTSAGILLLMGEILGDTHRKQGDPLSALRDLYVMGVGENYFTTLNIPILRGRDLEIRDRGPRPIPVILNQTLARDAFAGTDPMGQRLLMGREKEDLLEIVGLAVDFKMRTSRRSKHAGGLQAGF